MTIPLHDYHVAGRASKHTILSVTPALADRNRLTTAFRPILALPHILLVGAPTAFGLTMVWQMIDGDTVNNIGPGLLGLVAGAAALIAWFAILFTGECPRGLWQLASFYLRWRARAMAYMALLRDEYPPFGDERYPFEVQVVPPSVPRDRVTTAFRIFLLVPHFIVLWLITALWLVTTLIAWFAILFTGNFPAALYEFGVGVLRWSLRVEAYLLLLHDEYPPFTLEA